MNRIKLPRLRPGSRIGDELVVLTKISRGTPDPIYAVWHSSACCPMICKMFSSRRRSARETAAARIFAHPNIARSLGGVEPDYLLMEYLDGPRLDAFVQKQRGERLAVNDALRLATHLAAALSHIQKCGYAHMDVKPENVAVVNGRPILFDFGSMRAFSERRPNYISGTDPYIAPEEIELAANFAGADVFSFGVTLFEILTGSLPFPQRHKRDRYPQLTRKAIPLRNLRPSAPKALEVLLAGCLARDPEQRPEFRELIPRLNALIGRGARMWPDSFDPFATRRTGRREAA